MNQARLTTLMIPVLTITRCDRWQVSQRLLDLSIPCQWSTEGFLQVEVNQPLDAILIRSVILQFTASRTELVDWLDRCWDAPNSRNFKD